jgi:hypothetical protein
MGVLPSRKQPSATRLISSEVRKMARGVTAPLRSSPSFRRPTALVADGYSVAEAARPIGVTEKTYREWQTEYGGLARLLGPTLPRKNRRPKRSPRM